MSYLVDTSVLARLANVSDRLYPVAQNAIVVLHRQREVLRIAPQNLIELRNSATRPVSVNGLGLSQSAAEAIAASFEIMFPILPELPDIFPAWKALVQHENIIGKQVHDARLAAICHVNGISNVLTFNVAHFLRISAYGPGLTIVDPNNI